ncbi:Coiled-coil domain-containing protein 151 [Symbiodinium microadriaticum]|uniref:Coiled-coil domain-containing protein 151 n=1 Tax=Symbiodinium microadriaticum TaxID=2951 RepID=A0A1Q9D944_SYMMI|nr:Coiled-coil domain-containing protein 151 [Symbiodinium microadriaticum]
MIRAISYAPLVLMDPVQGPARSTVGGLTGEKLQAFRQWTCCFCVCIFDLEQGQRLELETPGDSPLSEEDRQLLRYLAFPDSGPSRLTSVETAVFPFRFRRGSGASRGRRSASRDLPLKDDFWYAAAYFQQQPDEASKRHCVQRSLVVVSQHGFLAFWAALVTEVGKHFQERGPDVLEEAQSFVWLCGGGRLLGRLPPPVGRSGVMAKNAMTPEEQLEDLQRRFQLLEGERKATYETAKLNIQQNKEIIGQMKDENKTLRNQIATLRDEKPQSLEKILEQTCHEVQQMQRRFDLLKNENNKRRGHIEQLSIKQGELSMGSKMHSSEASPEMRHIRVLENRLDKVMIKYNEAQSIRKTYEAIVKRLKDERIGFDNQLAAIERTLKAKERDYEELLLLSHDAYHAKEMAQAELHRFEQGVMEERNQRDKEVQEKKILVEQRVEMNKRLELREKSLKQQPETDKGHDRSLKEASVASEFTAGYSGDAAQEELQKIMDYKEAVQAIKDATGVSDANEIIQKFLTQEDTQKNLQQLTKENQETIDRLTEDRKKLRLQVEDLKFSSGGQGGRRQAIDDFESHLGEATEKFERNRGKYERVARLLIDMKAGIGHLSEKLQVVKLEGETTIDPNDDKIEVEHMLEQCELKISKLLSLTAPLEDVSDRQRRMDDEKYEEKLMLRSQSEARIKLNVQEEEHDDDDDDLDEELDDEVSHRKQIKYNSERVEQQQQIRNKRMSSAWLTDTSTCGRQRSQTQHVDVLNSRRGISLGAEELVDCMQKIIAVFQVVSYPAEPVGRTSPKMGCSLCVKDRKQDAVSSAASTTGDAVGASKTKVHVGPLEIDSSGVVVKPKFNLGIAGGSLYALAGVRDVRDGLAVDGLAMYMKSYSSSGASLVEVLSEIKAQEPIPVLDDLITAVPQIISLVLETVGVDIDGANVATVEGVVYVYVGAGVTAGIYLGWVDTQGYAMIGLEGRVATAAGAALALRAGLNEEKLAARVVSYLTNVGFDMVVKFREPCQTAK